MDESSKVPARFRGANMIFSSEDQFNANARKYAVSDVHRAGPSLPVLLEMAAPVANDYGLDAATGTGHTALAVARYVKREVGLDIASKMLEQAKRLAVEQGISNCEFVEGSAEAMPFASGQFSLVTARHAPHHFHRVDAFLTEVGRVMTDDGRFVMVDQITPSIEMLDWVNAWERMRDPSHFDQRTVDQWKSVTAKAGFRWISHQIVPYRLDFAWWVKQAGCNDATISALAEHGANASKSVRELFGLEFDESGAVKSFQEPMLVVRLER
jgi:ubiquinone/menaquinone biosynthesis C-methylase UbiE